MNECVAGCLLCLRAVGSWELGGLAVVLGCAVAGRASAKTLLCFVSLRLVFAVDCGPLVVQAVQGEGYRSKAWYLALFSFPNDVLVQWLGSIAFTDVFHSC
jgi:hypothetical protein